LEEGVGYDMMLERESIYTAHETNKKCSTTTEYYFARYNAAEITIQLKKLQTFAWLSAQDACEKMGDKKMNEMIGIAEQKLK
jgi:hypothetical protein